MKWLLGKKKVSTEVRDSTSWTPLHVAAHANHLEIVQLLGINSYYFSCVVVSALVGPKAYNTSAKNIIPSRPFAVFFLSQFCSLILLIIDQMSLLFTFKLIFVFFNFISFHSNFSNFLRR